ncbi:Lrp/AsnC family transcriptional regulator [Caulobacter sp. 17J80-11]|uniref:Lrp/AsnC family transcriptional regulator n=1 Tax=Caulobacter sp. 17J80-11 TaxID=2763502 RepID=UPI0016536666|nr:Lrp/AsnC family transcriptional regulator [Caulobacter sp. 17J80-11]MBC6983518.1 Lrp/AsnC family transcriptional regulator [Caulobacter sp. 17J80-11]
MIDSFDARLLAALQADNQQTGAELADQVGLSSAACLRRAQRLRERGVITADVSLVAPEKVGRSLTMIVLVELEREQAERVEAFKAAMSAAPEVMQCWYVTGRADFVLTLTVRDMADYQAFSARFFDDPNIRGFETLVAMDRVKFGGAVPVG